MRIRRGFKNFSYFLIAGFLSTSCLSDGSSYRGGSTSQNKFQNQPSLGGTSGSGSGNSGSGSGSNSGNSGTESGSGNNGPGTPVQQIVSLDIQYENGNAGPFYVGCPTGYVIMGGGTRLLQWTSGSNQPDSSYPDPSEQRWVVHLGGPQSGQWQSRWRAYAICAREDLVETQVLEQTIMRSGTNLAATMSCPSGMQAMSAGTRLVDWRHGNPNIDQSFPSAENSADWNFVIGGPQSSQRDNQWTGYLVCARGIGNVSPSMSRTVVQRTAAVTATNVSGSISANCPSTHQVAGGSTKLETWIAGINTIDAAYPIGSSGFQWVVGDSNASKNQNTWHGYAVCMRLN